MGIVIVFAEVTWKRSNIDYNKTKMSRDFQIPRPGFETMDPWHRG